MNSCCEDLTNRSDSEKISETMSVQFCTACGRKHYELNAEPIKVGIKIGS